MKFKRLHLEMAFLFCLNNRVLWQLRTSQKRQEDREPINLLIYVFIMSPGLNHRNFTPVTFSNSNYHSKVLLLLLNTMLKFLVFQYLKLKFKLHSNMHSERSIFKHLRKNGFCFANYFSIFPGSLALMKQAVTMERSHSKTLRVPSSH